ncbi:TM2 domain protein [Corynebacterium occultum]|uniref:TM2 domain protein n=1 Tax=Corynebacterium occultum TaxID=2675219 RepID=A0A6B8WB72_9CORY|nr:TM2 domain-containing protein [Corynebacterium occultum]QGU07260.1 TM2 domain protein [Corynebacterium occultum]
MTNPNGGPMYDKDGLPINPQGPTPFAQPGYNPQNQGYQQAYQQPLQNPGFQNFAQAPQQNYGQMQPQQSYSPAQYGQKSMIIAAVLAFFLGPFGVHNFYLGYMKRGATQLALYLIGIVLSIVGIGIIFIFAVGVWAFVEFIMILVRHGRYATDATGVPLA